MKNAIRKFGTFVLALSLGLATSSATFANNDKNNETSPIDFRFVGKFEQQPLYQLNISNTEGDEYTINFSDAMGNLLYSTTTRSETFTKRFAINPEISDEQVTVSITSKKSNKSYVFNIKRSHNVVEENKVERIK